MPENKEETIRTTFEIPISLLKLFKKKLIDNQTNMKDTLNTFIEKYVKDK